MREASWQKVNDIVVESSLALLGSCGIEAGLVDTSKSSGGLDLQTIAIMGFVGADLRGSVCLVAAAELLERSYPVTGAGERDLKDWAGELANQLLGRIKNKFLSLGIAIDLSTPTTLRGKDITFGEAGHGAHSSKHSFHADDGDVLVRFEAQVRPSMTIVPGASSAESNAEGDILLF